MTISSGDEFTGLAHGSPTTKNPKGIVLVEAVERNFHQLSLDFGADYKLEVAPRPRLVPNANLTMIFLMRTVRYTPPNEPTKTEYRAEISTPRAMEGEYIRDWHERILLPSISGDEGTPTKQGMPTLPLDFGPVVDINVPVQRKKGA